MRKSIYMNLGLTGIFVLLTTFTSCMQKENERMRKEMDVLMKKEKHSQQVELLKQQNKITEDRIAYLKDMERKLKQVVFDWKKAESAEDKRVDEAPERIAVQAACETERRKGEKEDQLQI